MLCWKGALDAGMMAFNTSTRKEDVSMKLRVSNMRNTQEQTRRLEEESHNMEERLHELKMAMSREKEERERDFDKGFWDKGQTGGSLGGYAKEVLNKPNKPKGPKGPKKVTVLKDEPAVVPERSKGRGTMRHIAKYGAGGGSAGNKENFSKGSRCGQCEDRGAQVSCVECGEDYCAPCFASFHLKGNLRKHRSVPFGSQHSNRTPRGMTTPRKSKSLTVAFQDEPEHGMMPLAESPQAPPPFRKPASESGSDVQNDGPSLFEGIPYSEADSALSFQAALKAWRGPEPNNNTKKQISPARPVGSMEHSTSTDSKPIEITFKQGGLTYAEKLLLKKHRRTDLAPLPSMSLSENDASLISETSSVVSPYSNRNLMSSLDETEAPQETFVEELQPLSSADSEGGLVWRDVHRAIKSDSQLLDDERAESRVSIIELDNETDIQVKPRKRRGKQEDQTSAYQVTEVGQEEDLQILSARKQSASKARKKPSSSRKDKSSRSSNPDFTASSKLRASVPLNSSITVEDTGTVDLSIDLTQKKSTEVNQAKSRTSSARVKSARVKSARSRPQSRARSRAATRLALFGEGEITKAPSSDLRDVARMTPRVESRDFRSTMGDFFTAGTTSSGTDDHGSQKKSNDPSIPKWKVSNQLYSMGPRSWKPANSVQDVTDEDVTHTLEETAKHIREFLSTPEEEKKLETVSFSVSSGIISRETSFAEHQKSQLEARLQLIQPQSSRQTPRLSHSRNSTRSSSHSVTPSLTSSQQPDDITPRPPSRPESRAIEVDGDDLSVYDGNQNTARKEQNEEDEDALNQLEWELASHEGRITEDGKLSRLSMLSPEPDEEDEETPRATFDDEDTSQEFRKQQLAALIEARAQSGYATPGASLDTRMNDLMDDFEDMEREIMEEEVKALH